VRSFRAELDSLTAEIGDESCAAVSVDGVIVDAANPTLPVIPASTMKVVTAAVALDTLGPDHVFTTTVTGDVAGGVVTGDLTLVGGGDPLLSTEFWPESNVQTYPPFNTTSLGALAQSVVDAGVTRIEGNVVGDGSRYDDERYRPSWSEEIRITSGGPIGGLLVNDARTSLENVAADPAAGAALLFADQLRIRGVVIDGEPVAGPSASGNVIASIDSVPLTDVVAELLQTSDNNTAEMLVKEIGVAAAGQGTSDAGLQVMSATLQEWGVDIAGIVLADGSGLSRDNRLTCTALVGVLARTGLDDPLAAGLAVAATSGTLVDRFVDTEVAGIMRAKTGTLSGVRSLAGYVPPQGPGAADPAAEPGVVEFAIVLNQLDAGEVIDRVVEDEFVPAVITYPATSSIADLGPR
jgi:D-alanyl-D-alanine carboxypeptidase/D-alanyl-D-alanine-endopeptidase (penicillin-binding protein 4)